MTNKKCAPHKEYKDGSCFSLDELKIIAHNYNKSVDTKQVNGKKIDIKSNDKKQLLNTIVKQLPQCNNDHICIISQKFIINKKLKNIFKPQGTKGQYDWLSTLNINDVLRQYELKYKDFKFGGAVPSDVFSYKKEERVDYPLMDTNLNIQHLDLHDLNIMGIKKIAFVYNLDKSYQSGSHWVALFCNLDKCQVYFFDSYGQRPSKDIRSMIEKLANMCYNKHNTTCVKECNDLSVSQSFMMETGKNKLEKLLSNIDYNRNRNQYKNTECGVYSINFIVQLLNGKKFKEIIDNPISDEEINKLRKKYYR
tara:strand:+ start:412 stop:1335 length:924 start_codon:yes stop_codon:yes gene_type:complete